MGINYGRKHGDHICIKSHENYYLRIRCNHGNIAVIIHTAFTLKGNSIYTVIKVADDLIKSTRTVRRVSNG